MQFDFQNKYFRVAILWVFMSVAIWLLLFFVLMLLNFSLPLWMEFVVAALGAGYLINLFFFNRLG